jgi:hypothetical protein
MSDARWSYAKLHAWANIDGTDCDIVGFTLNFELNGLPNGTIQLPTGIAEDGTIAAIHTIIGRLKVQKPVTIYGQMVAAASSDSAVSRLGVPEGPFILFQGLSAGGGYMRGTTQASYILRVNHVLVRLNQASAFSDSMHPSNPSDFSYGMIMLGSSETGAEDFNALTAASDMINEITLSMDVWGDAVYQWFYQLTQEDGMWIEEQLLAGDGTNAQAQAAMQLLAPGGPGYNPIVFNESAAVDEHIADLIAADLAQAVGNPDAVANQTLWDILIGYFMADYMLALVPTAQGAVIVPYMPCTRAPTPIVITADQESLLEMEMDMPRPIRAMGIMSGIGSRTGVSDPDVSSTIGIGGWYDVPIDGYVKFDRGPRWTGNITSPSLYAAESSGGDLQEPISNAHRPGKGKKNNAGDGAKKRAKESIKPFLDMYAQARFAQEVLRGRFAIVASPFRLDIVPGATVKIEGPREEFIGAADQLGQEYYGEVLRVTIQMNANTGQAGTSYHVGYVRTADEHEDENLTIEKHPLYETVFQANEMTLLSSTGAAPGA